MRETPKPTREPMTEERLVSMLASSYYWPGAEWDDVAQEARYALERARSTFDPTRGVWLRFAWFRVRDHLIEQVRRETRRRPQFAFLSEEHAELGDVVDLVAARETLRRVVSTPLSELEREALGRCIRGEPVSGSGRKALDNALVRARRKVAA